MMWPRFSRVRGTTFDALLCDMNGPPEESIEQVIRLSRCAEEGRAGCLHAQSAAHRVRGGAERTVSADRVDDEGGGVEACSRKRT
jgi:hypothetical protein